MSFVNRKFTSRATFALFLTATILASCSSDDSSSTGRLKNSIGSDGQLCYTDEERASLLLGAVAIPERKKIEYQAAVEARPAVKYKAEVKYQAAKAATALVPAKPEVPEVLYQAAVSYQPAVPFRPAGWFSTPNGGRWNPFDPRNWTNIGAKIINATTVEMPRAPWPGSDFWYLLPDFNSFNWIL